ncbi:NAD(P)/FAD-dependent oxidoreductase [Streptomyces sp. NPDC087425]|uniref:NAD(P)/FAD-dependent oxidoreductase n=2 Tax=unclassified Streptomyces TaxID=2593676 RepID=UPI0037FF61A0
MPERHADVLVVGGGAIGLAAAREVARRGRSVCVLERFALGHERGGSAGWERQWRIQYSQERWARLALETLPLWRQLEAEAERPLVHARGSLWFGQVGVATSEGELALAAAVLDALEVPYDWLTALEIERRFGFAALPRDHEGFHQADGGVIDVRATLEALAALGVRSGVRVVEHLAVHALEPDGAGVTVRTARGDFRAESVIVACGAFTDALLAPLGCGLGLRVFRMASAHFARRRPDVDLPTWYAFLESAETGANESLYGFGHDPWTGNDLVRVAPDAELPVEPGAEADTALSLRAAEQLDRTARWVRAHLPGLTPRPTHPGTCLAALPADPEREFYLGTLAGRIPDGERIVVQAAGWAFKFVPAFGRTCADLATGSDAPPDRLSTPW